MTFGDDWGWGASKEDSRRIFDAFAEAGGNFIDMANNYTEGTSERIVGECIHAERDRYVVATKFTLRLNSGDAKNANLGGNSRKSMARSVEQSLRNLQTDYLDLLYLHVWDFTTPVDEVLSSVDALVKAGKVLYFAFSDTPAWVVSHAIARADAHGWPKPVAMQAPHSLLDRGVERDLWPMARHFGMAMLPWGMLEGGVLTGKYSQPSDGSRRNAGADANEIAAGEAVVAMAKEIERAPSQVAINWVRQQPGNVIPILGCRTVKQIGDNLGCLDFRLSDEHMARLNAISNFRPGFPSSFVHSDHVRRLIFGDTFALIDRV
jgi:aryl-alcohol dehydrogenase-like predicted oxidoreductase